MKLEKWMAGVKVGAEEDLDNLARRAQRRLERELTRMRRPEAAVGVTSSPLGDLLVAATHRGIALIHYLSGSGDALAAIDQARARLDLVEDFRIAERVGLEVTKYLAGSGDALRMEVDLLLAGGSFQQKVLQKLQEVPRGAALSYQALSAAAGVPAGARAVGNAMHANPVPIYVPCHRVIAANGGLGGYGGGAERKIRLLRCEGFHFQDESLRLSAGSVWGHRQTRIFCRHGCSTAARVDRHKVLFFADARAAQRAGLRPCQICRPETNNKTEA